MKLVYDYNSWPYFPISIIYLPVPGPPASFDVIARGTTHMDLGWTEPYEPNGILTGYQISYQTGKRQCYIYNVRR